MAKKLTVKEDGIIKIIPPSERNLGYKIIDPFSKDFSSKNYTVKELREYSANIRKTVNQQIRRLERSGLATFSQAYRALERAGYKTEKGQVGFKALPTKSTKAEYVRQIRTVTKALYDKSLVTDFVKAYHEQELADLGLSADDFGSEQDLKNFYKLYDELKNIKFFDRFNLGSQGEIELLKRFYKQRPVKGNFKTIAQKAYNLSADLDNKQIVDFANGVNINKKTPIYKQLVAIYELAEQGINTKDKPNFGGWK